MAFSLSALSVYNLSMPRPFPLDTKLGRVMWQKNVTITALCENTGLHRNTIGNLLAGKNGFTASTLALVARALKVEPEDILEGADVASR